MRGIRLVPAVHALWVTAWVLAAAACVSAPARRPLQADLDIPENWTAREVEAPEERPDAAAPDWWTSFDDPRLQSLLEEALRQNHDLKVAAARLEQAEAQARIAGADLTPDVAAGLSAARQRQNFVGLPIPGQESRVLSTSSTRYGVSLDTAWEVDLWGRLRAGARAAVADMQAAAAELRGARLSLAAQVSKAWFAAVEARQQLQLAEDTAASRRESAETVRSRYRRGLRPAVDLRLALSQLADAETLVEQRRSQLDPVVRQLEVLAGRYPRGALVEAIGAAELPEPPPPVPAGLPAELIARRPDLVAAERRLAAAGQRRRQARRALYPRLSLTAGGGTASNELQDLVDRDFRVWSLLANLAQPLFQGGRLRAGVVRAQAVEQEALAGFAGTALVAFAEVETALAVESLLGAQERHIAESVRQLAAATSLALDRYRRGVGDYLTVLEAQTRELSARSSLLSVRRRRLDNRVDLHLALGGGFEEPAAAELATVRAPEHMTRPPEQAP